MALTDYKIRRITKKENGDVEVVMAVYEGAITTEQEIDPVTDKLVDVKRYRRTSKLKEVIKVITGNPTESAIKNELGIELNKDLTRTPIDEQKIV